MLYIGKPQDVEFKGNTTRILNVKELWIPIGEYETTIPKIPEWEKSDWNNPQNPFVQLPINGKTLEEFQHFIIEVNTYDSWIRSVIETKEWSKLRPSKIGEYADTSINNAIHVGILTHTPYTQPPEVFVGIQNYKGNNTLLIASDQRVGEVQITLWGLIQPDSLDEETIIIPQ